MENYQKLLAEHYFNMYSGKEKHDSPDVSRTDICRKIIEIIKLQNIPNRNILDIGSGPQSLEKELLAFRSKEDKTMLKEFSITTLDVAFILKNKNLALKFDVGHIQADSKFLPFKNNNFGIVISNHSIDFIPNRDRAFQEVLRVMSNKGIVIFNFHHKDILNNLPDKSNNVKKYWNYLKENNLLFDSEAKINSYLEKFGYKDINIEEKTDKKDKWWMICAKKY